jgi:hypothetical protein
MKHIKLFEAFVNESSKTYSLNELQELSDKFSDFSEDIDPNIDFGTPPVFDKIEMNGETTIITLEYDEYDDSGATNTTYTKNDGEEDFMPQLYGMITITIKKGKVTGWDDKSVEWEEDAPKEKELDTIRKENLALIKDHMQKFLIEEGMIDADGAMK